MAAQIVPPDPSLYTNQTVIAELQAERARFTGARRAFNTERGYRYDAAAFTRWTAQMGLTSLPASPDTLCLYVTAMLRKLKVSTCARRVAAVSHLHRSNGFRSPATEEVRELLRGARRLRMEQVDQVLPLALEELRAELVWRGIACHVVLPAQPAGNPG
jgi:hypothetical protein